MFEDSSLSYLFIFDHFLRFLGILRLEDSLNPKIRKLSAFTVCVLLPIISKLPSVVETKDSCTALENSLF